MVNIFFYGTRLCHCEMENRIPDYSMVVHQHCRANAEERSIRTPIYGNVYQ